MLPASNYRRSINSTLIQSGVGTDHGVPLPTLLAGTGITPEMMASPQVEIDASQELTLIRNLVDATTQIPGIGLQAGLRYHLTTYGLLGFALTSSPTLRAAIEMALRYVHLTFTFAQFSVTENDGQAYLHMEDRDIPEAVRQFLVERDFAGIQNMFQEALGMALPVGHIHFRFTEPSYSAMFQQIFGLMPQFGQAHNCVVFDARFLDLPLPQANEHTKLMCETMCRELLQQRRARQGLASRIRDRMLRMPLVLPDMEVIAAEFCMTSRSLRRHLDKEGTSFRALSDEIRETLAEQFLRDGLTVEEIAGRLGYTESSSFTQAFKRWKGISPKAYRVSLGGSARVNRAPEE